eukprot:m.1481338 g.1481338  ORF g.1481338 m.1481338 type:complete len:224 (-) comp25175_c0_seq3:213-884(-)
MHVAGVPEDHFMVSLCLLTDSFSLCDVHEYHWVVAQAREVPHGGVHADSVCGTQAATCTNAQLPEFQASQWRLLPRSVSVNLSHNALRDTGIFAVVNSFTLNKTGIFELDASYNNVSQLRPFMIPTMKEPGSWGGHIVERTTGYSIGLAHNPIALIPNTTFAGHNMDFLEAISLDLSNREAIDGHALPPLEIEPLVFSNATIERGVWRSAPFNLSIDLTGTYE